MDGRLCEAARTGNVSALHQLLAENPLILVDFALFSPHENPLHIATKAGQLRFVQEIIKHKADFVRQVNQDGFRPLDIASAIGHVEIVKEIITTCNHDVFRLKGRYGRTSLHYAAMYGRIEIIDELLSTCDESVKDVTSLGETAPHLALKYYQFEAFANLFKWLEKLGLEELVNWGDNDGNTTLHLAVSRKQPEQSVKLLLSSRNIGSKLKLNGKNSRVFTAMDLVDIMNTENPNDIQLKEILQSAGALATQIPHHIVLNNQTSPEPSGGVSKDWINYFQFQKDRDSPGDARNALLVVAALIASITFQAGMNPPTSFLLEETTTTTSINNANDASPPSPPAFMPNPAVTSVFVAIFANSGNSLPMSHLFVFGNTLGLAASLSIIIYLTNRFPFQRELQISIYSMMFAYGCAVHDLKPRGASKYILLGTAFLLPFLLRWPPRWIRKLWKWLKGNSNHEAKPL